MESGMLSDFFKTSMMLRGQPNITTEEYLQLVKQVKKAALRDMEMCIRDRFKTGHGV